MMRICTVLMLLLFSVVDVHASAGPNGYEPDRKHTPVLHGFDVLVFSKTAGYRHDSISAGIAALESLGTEHEFDVVATEDASVFSDEGLSPFDVIVFLNTTGDVLNEAQQDAMERFIAAGKGFVGIHSAADTEYNWDWYEEAIGAHFDNHPEIQSAQLIIEDRVHPATSHLDLRWERTDEWYAFRRNPRGDVHVLISLNEQSYSGGTMGYDHPWAWCNETAGGRIFYTGGGHTTASYSEEAFRAHLLGGLEWAAGAVSGDCGATQSGNFEKTILDDDTRNPLDLVVLPTGEVLYLERGGQVRSIDPDTGISSTVLERTVDLSNEDGLLGIVLDPFFDQNSWIYLFYSPPGDPSYQQVSRFTWTGDRLDPSSEVSIIQIPVDREECCHSAGSMVFDPDGNLLIATGDNTNPFDSDGYTPIDDRQGRPYWDARRTSGNSNDLRGKILRITPRAEGGYDIPSGNLYPPGTPQTLPEIYVMGVRNPFRISLDSNTGWLYWGDVGPDADNSSSARGPKGYDEWNQARQAGNFGWPYCIADNQSYVDWDFSSNSGGGLFDCLVPVNTSAFNTGLQQLPPSEPAWIYYPYGASSEFPAITEGPGRTAIAGPVFRSGEVSGSYAFPEVFDGSFFIAEWTRGWIKRVLMDEEGEVLTILPFGSEFSFQRPIALKSGPDGALYGIDWGSGFSGDNEDSNVFRIDYRKGTRSPIIDVTTSELAGTLPLTVSFDASASRDPDPGDVLSYSWDFTSDGTVDETGAITSHTFTVAGEFTTSLVVEDAQGNQSSRSFSIIAGNTAPEVSVSFPPAGGVFHWGDTLSVAVTVVDAEDGSTEDGTISCDRVESQLFIGHDEHGHPLDIYGGCEADMVLPEGHGGDGGRIFLVLESRYSDTAQGDAGSVAGRGESFLYPHIWEAEHYDDQSGIELEGSNDPTGGSVHLAFIDSGDYVKYADRSLRGISHITFRVASAGLGGTISLRQGALNGPLLGRTAVPVTGGWQTFADVTMSVHDPGGASDLYLVFEHPSGGGGLFNINRMRFDGAGISRGTWTDGSGLEMSLYENASFSGTPERSDVPGVSWYWGENEVAVGSLPRPFSGTWRGSVIAPASGTLRFMLQSWGEATVLLDGEEVIELTELGGGMAEGSVLVRALEGQVFDLQVTYIDESGPAGALLTWQGSGFIRRPLAFSDTRMPGSSTVETQTMELPADHLTADLFPNPVGETFTARIKCASGNPVEYVLTDVLGRQVRRDAWVCPSSGSMDNTMDVNGLSPGVYFAVVQSAGMKIVRSVVRSP